MRYARADWLMQASAQAQSFLLVWLSCACLRFQKARRLTQARNGGGGWGLAVARLPLQHAGPRSLRVVDVAFRDDGSCSYLSNKHADSGLAAHSHDTVPALVCSSCSAVLVDWPAACPHAPLPGAAPPCRACRLTCIHTLELPEALRPIANTSRSARRPGPSLPSPLQASRHCAALLRMACWGIGADLHWLAREQAWRAHQLRLTREAAGGDSEPDARASASRIRGLDWSDASHTPETAACSPPGELRRLMRSSAPARLPPLPPSFQSLPDNAPNQALHFRMPATRRLGGRRRRS
jgi:hypothetical protein